MSNASYTFPSVVINNTTYTAKRWGQFPTISFTNGAIAGSEVVTVDSSFNITVQIQSGVSTNLQIKTAIAASVGSANGLSAGDLITVAITGGHNSDTNVAGKNATLASGTAAAKARLTIGHLVYTAQTAGAAGNNIRLKYTSGGSLSVSVSSLDITVQLKNDGSSTNTLIAAAVAASGPAAALVLCTSDGLAMSFVPTTAMATAFANLAGGTDLVAASVIVQDLTFKSWPAGIAGNGATISYTTGATAGSEVVSGTVAAASVQIQSGTSTATQIKAALDAATISAVKASGTVTFGSPSNGDTVTIDGIVFTKAASASGLNFTIITDLTAAIVANCPDVTATDNGTVVTVTAINPGVLGNAIAMSKTGSALTLSGATLASGRDGIQTVISGTGSTAQKTTNASAMTGAVGAQSLSFYQDQSVAALTASYVYSPFNGPATTITIINDETSGAKTVVYSFDGTNEAGQIPATASLSIQAANKGGIYLKYSSAAPAYRVMAVLY